MPAMMPARLRYVLTHAVFAKADRSPCQSLGESLVLT